MRVYGLLVRNGKVLVAAEQLVGRNVLKFPGGAVEVGETPEQAVVREFQEEGQMTVSPTRLLYTPGTLFSPWTHADYTPIYYAVAGQGEPRVPDHEPLTLTFMDPDDFITSELVAQPEIIALSRALNGDQ